MADTISNSRVGERGQPPTVLVVEDDTDLAELYSIWLQDSYTLRVAHDTATALECVDDTVDVALLDRDLPDGSGVDVLEEIRACEYEIRVSLVTGVEPGFDIVEMGFDEYLVKPVTRQKLCDTVERLHAQSEYAEAIQEFYALASTKATLEMHHAPGELTDAAEYTTLLTRMESLRDEVNHLTEDFSTEQFGAEWRRLSE